MLAKTAEIDLKALRDSGFSPTDAEVVRLNDIALQIEHGKDTTAVNAPRVAFAGNVVLHEPTIGALQWWYNYGMDSAQSDSQRMNTQFFMLAHARNLDYLNSLERDSDIRAAVKKWMRGVNATEGELWRALLYVKNAYQFEDEDAETEEETDENMMDNLWMNVIACAGALSVTPEDLMTVTQSELVSLLVHANLHAQIPMKKSIAKQYIAYKQLIRKIEERGRKENGGK